LQQIALLHLGKVTFIRYYQNRNLTVGEVFLQRHVCDIVYCEYFNLGHEKMRFLRCKYALYIRMTLDYWRHKQEQLHRIVFQPALKHPERSARLYPSVP